MRTAFAVLIVGAALSTAAAQSQSITAQAAVRPEVCIIGEAIEFIVAVEVESRGDDLDLDLPQPTPPTSPDYEMTFSERRLGAESTQMSIINGRRSVTRSQTVNFIFALKPKKLGAIAIPSFVYEAKRVVQTLPETRFVVEKEAPGNRFATLEVKASTLTPYVNQPVTLSFSFKAQKPICSKAVVAMPWASNPNGFFGEALPALDRLGSGQLVEIRLNGEPYAFKIAGRAGDQALVFERTIYPVAPGRVEIAPTSIVAELATRTQRDFFGSLQATETAKAVLASEPLVFEVRDAPLAGRPGSFDGIIGDFTVDARYGKTEIKAGDGVTLSLVISGPGDLQSLRVPDLTGFDDFDIYPPDRSVKEDRGARALSVSWLLVPKTTAVKEMPKFEFSWFAPASASFKTVACGPSRLTISGSARNEGVFGGAVDPVTKDEIRTFTEDIRPIRLRPEGFAAAESVSLGVILATFLLPFSLIGGLAVLVDRRRRLRGDVVETRKKRASKEAAARLAEAHGLIDAGRDFYGKASKSLAGFIADKLGVPPASVSHVVVRDLLGQVGVDRTLVEEVATILADFDTKQFGAPPADPAERRSALAAVESAIRKLDKAIKR